MENENLTLAASQLDRTLSFFPRVDGKVSWLFAINTGMLGLSSLNIKPEDLRLWYVGVPATITAITIGVSMFFLYRCSFPHLEGGKASLFYFREIARRTESNYIQEFASASAEQRTRDLLGQVWRNAEILNIKFDAVRISFFLTAVAIIPWCWFLASVSLVHTQVPTVK